MVAYEIELILNEFMNNPQKGMIYRAFFKSETVARPFMDLTAVNKFRYGTTLSGTYCGEEVFISKSGISRIEKIPV